MPQGEPAERHERETVVPLELFFDLVFVYAFTQVTTLLIDDPTWGGVLRAGLLLSVLWWAWSAYAWLTNTLDPEEGGVRMLMLAAIAAMLIASIAAPRAFGRDATTFADRVPDRPRPAPRALRDRRTRGPRALARRAAHRAIGVPELRAAPRCQSSGTGPRSSCVGEPRRPSTTSDR